MKFIDAEQVHRRLNYPSLVAGLERLHAQDVHAMQDLMIDQPAGADGTNRFFLRAAWQRDKAVGVKLVTIFPDNLTNESELPTVQGVYVLFDGETGEPTFVIDGTALTWRKTAGDSALGAKFLARDDVETMLMVGAGAMAPELITAHHAIRPSLRRILVWNRSAARSTRLCETLALANVELTPTDDLEDGARNADLICCATASSAPLIKGAWLAPGTHLDLVGGFTPETREADDDAIGRGRLFVDSRDTTLGHVGDLIDPMETGVITAADIVADHFQLCRGERRGRENADEITIFKNGGGGHLDLMTARLLLERATVVD